MSRFVLPRPALFLSAVALITVAACQSVDVPSSVQAPALKPKNDVITTGDRLQAGNVEVCVDPTSAPGTYTFTTVAVQPATGTGTVTTPKSIVAGVGTGCSIVFTRNTKTPTCDAPGNDPNQPGGGWICDYPQSRVTVTSSVRPAGTNIAGEPDCILDLGTQPPEECTEIGENDGGVVQVVVYANFFHGTQVVVKFTGPPPACTLGYPNNDNARTTAVFNESEVLSAWGREGDEIRVWYTDEHALTLGVRRYSVDNKSPAVDPPAIDYSIAAMVGNPSSATGTPLLVGWTQYGVGQAVDGAGRPLHPSLFITDLTGAPTGAKTGDWQYGGTPRIPNAVYGTWKGAAILLNNNRNPAVVSMTPDADPAKNHKNVGAFPAAAPPAAAQDFGFSSEIVWKISQLGLDPTHTYRIQVMVHDGDQNKTGGDVGQACFHIGPDYTNFVQVPN